MYHIKIVLRTLIQGRMYTLISVLGLTLGLSVSMLIASVVMDEFSYDRHWSRSQDIYRLISVNSRGADLHNKNGGVYAGLAPQLKENFSEVEEYSTLYVSPIHFKFDKQESQPVEVTALYTDSAVHHLLDVQLIAADNLDPVQDVNKIIISERIAKTYFENGNALGKTIYDLPPYEEKSNLYHIVGIMKDLSPNSHLRNDVVILGKRTIRDLRKDDSGIYTRDYILLKPGVNPKQLEAKINTWYKDYVTSKKPTQYELQPIRDSYLKTDFGAYQIIKGNLQHLYIFSGIAVLILLIACINFVNLSTARASSRLKETGIRKVLGASKSHLIKQFLLESLFSFASAALLAFLFYYIALPSVENFIGHSLAPSSISGWKYRLFIVVSVMLISLLSGLYPAWMISGFSMESSLNKSLRKNKSTKSYLRSTLVTTQFALSGLVLIAMFVVSQQTDYMKNKETGIDTEGLISIGHISFDQKSKPFKDKIEQNRHVQLVSQSSWLPTDGKGYMSSTMPDPRNPGQNMDIWYIAGEPNLAQTLGLKLERGRFLDPEMATDFIDANDLEAESNAIRPCIMTAHTAMLLDNPSLDIPVKDKQKLIPVGVVQDFNSESLHHAMAATVIVGYKDPKYGAMLIRTQPGTEKQVMKYIAQVWKEFYPDKLLDMAIVKEAFAAQYQAEEKMEKLFRGFSMLTLFLAAIGLFALIVNSVSLRVKEIGIRKVLGASVGQIVAMLSFDFVKLVLLASLIASPIAWWMMNKWLENFAFRITIPWWIFVLAGLIGLVIAVISVSGQAYRAANSNPVDSLRDE